MKKIYCLLFSLVMFVMAGYSQSDDENSKTITFDFSKADSVDNQVSSKVTTVGFERNKAFYEQKLKKAKTQKLVGIILASIGAAALGGTIGGYFAIRNKRSYQLNSYGVGELILYTGLPASVALISTGIPLSVIGAKKQKKYAAKLKKDF